MDNKLSKEKINKKDKEATAPLNATGKTVLASSDLQGHILSFYSLKDAAALSCSSKALHTALKRAQRQQKANLLLKHISAGDLTEAKKLIQQTAEADRLALLKQPAEAKDYFGRQFSWMTAFQYTLWDVSARPARDLLMQYMPDKEITRQLQAHYTNNNEGYNRHGKHFDFMPLIKALQDYKAFTSGQNQPIDWAEAAQKCRKEVGGAQRWSTAEIIHQYCHLKPHYFKNPRDSFASKTGGLSPKERHDKFCYQQIKAEVHLRDYLNDLGSNFALYRGTWAHRAGGDAWSASADLTAITALCEVRIQEFNALIARFAPTLPQFAFPHQPLPPSHTPAAP